MKGKTVVCCYNCSMLIPINGEYWCDLNDHEVVDPNNYRCKDFDYFDCEAREDSIKQEGM